MQLGGILMRIWPRLVLQRLPPVTVSWAPLQLQWASAHCSEQTRQRGGLDHPQAEIGSTGQRPWPGRR